MYQPTAWPLLFTASAELPAAMGVRLIGASYPDCAPAAVVRPSAMMRTIANRILCAVFIGDFLFLLLLVPGYSVPAAQPLCQPTLRSCRVASRTDPLVTAIFRGNRGFFHERSTLAVICNSLIPQQIQRGVEQPDRARRDVLQDLQCSTPGFGGPSRRYTCQ